MSHRTEEGEVGDEVGGGCCVWQRRDEDGCADRELGPRCSGDSKLTWSWAWCWTTTKPEPVRLSRRGG
jgi:hypothetical protein